MNRRTSVTRAQLTRYRDKRDFTRTAEPSGDRKSETSGQRYVIQKHAARRLHYDFRLELGGVLKSWAVTRGPSLNPMDKRLAVHVEDHPLDYGSFEGTIPQGQYGGGTVMLWDEGTWQPLGDAERDYARGNLSFALEGKRLKGRWHLVRLGGRGQGDAKRDNWLLIKGKDQYAATHGDSALEKYQTSVVSRRGMEGIAKVSSDPKKKAEARRQSATAAPRAVRSLKQSRIAKRTTRTSLTASDAGHAEAAFVPPQLATLVSAPPHGEGWVHEIKFDGYRLLAVLNNARARVFTRAGNDWSDRFAPLCRALEKLKVDDAVIDGEVVIADNTGASSFHALQDALSRGKLNQLLFYAFDLLHLNGMDLRARPLTERKAALEEVLHGALPILSYSRHFDEPGDRMLAHACEMALEGIISKQAGAPYRSGRTSAWLKSKCIKEQEFVIGGYTEQPKHPGVLGALLIGYYEKDALQFAGKVGTGFSAAEGAALLRKFKVQRARVSPFSALPTDARRGACFVDPQLVAHINFSEWTPDGRLRHPSYQGLREDKPALEVVREKHRSLSALAPSAAIKPKHRPKATPSESSTVAGVTITHPERVLWPEGKITKLELARYYAAIAPKLLADAGNRPISLMRCPQGSGGQCFFQRHAGDGMPEHVHAVKVPGRGDGKPFIFIDDVEGLVSLVQMGTIEVHAWNSLASAAKRPDRVIFDLDPAPEVAWKEVKTAAQDVRAALDKLGLQALLKTTGGKGLHLVVPIAPGPSWPRVKAFARGVCESLARAEPDRFTINNRKQARDGRIFLDYLRNDETASAVAAYSVRARPGAPVSLPIEWSELARLKCGDAFHIEDALKRRADPWKHLARLSRQTLPGS